MEYVVCPEGHVVLSSQVRTTDDGLKVCPVCHGAQSWQAQPAGRFGAGDRGPGAGPAFRPPADPTERTAAGVGPAPFSAFPDAPYSAATAPPPYTAVPPAHHESSTRPMLLGAVIAGVAILVAAAVLAFIPLPTQANAQGTVLGTCGPGTSSSSAVEVKIHPQIVNQGGGGGSTSNAAEDRAWANYCQGVANRRLILSGALGGVGALLSVSCGLAYRRTADRTT